MTFPVAMPSRRRLARPSVTAALLALLLGGSLAPLPAAAQTATERLVIASNATGTRHDGVIIGLTMDRFVLKARKGQTLTAALAGKSKELSVRVTPPGKRDPLYDGLGSKTPVSVTLPVDGDYVIEVYLGRGAGLIEVAPYRLDIDVKTPATQPPKPDPVGPGVWQVLGVPAGDLLNVRAGASTREPVVGRLKNGTAVQNLGCITSAGARWCQISSASPKVSGWASAKYLVEGKPSTKPTPDPAPVPEDGGPDYYKVKGVAAGQLLNVRSGASTDNAVVGRLENGAVVKNLGCATGAAGRWCKISSTSPKLTGWVSGRYLVEGSAPGTGGNPGGNTGGGGFSGKGKLPCSTFAGQPTHNCSYAVTGDGVGGARLTITLDDGTLRRIVFIDGEPVNSNLPDAISYRLSRGLFVIEVAGERYEVQQSIVTG